MVSKEKLVYLFAIAKAYKEDIQSSYNETFEYTDSNFKIEDKTERKTRAMRNVDSTILKSTSFLCNFLMSSIFSKTGKWATIKVNQKLFQDKIGTDGEVAKSFATEIDNMLEQNAETVYLTNDITNYYTETAKAVMDCIKVGTGIRKIIELKSNVKPFTYEYQNLDNIFILEDNLGKPNIIFKIFANKNMEQLQDLFGHLNFKKPSELTTEADLETTVSVIESIVSIFDENTATYKYFHGIHTLDFKEELYNGVLEYNPYTVFRWSVDSSNPWGIGIGRANLDLFKRLKKFKDLREKHSEKIVTPPINAFGNIDLIKKMNLKAGTVNYGGSGVGGDRLGVEPINTGTRLIEIDKDIADIKQQIREVFMAQPLGDVNDTKNRSATEMSLRHEMFRKEFSGTYELINTELLEPTFLNAYYILDKKGLLLQSEDNPISYSQVQYINELTRVSSMQEVQQVLSFQQMLASVIPEQERAFILNNSKLIEWCIRKLRIPLEIVYSEEEREQMQAQRDQLAQMQQLAQVQQQVGQGTDIGLAEKLEQGVNDYEL